MRHVLVCAVRSAIQGAVWFAAPSHCTCTLALMRSSRWPLQEYSPLIIARTIRSAPTFAGRCRSRAVSQLLCCDIIHAGVPPPMSAVPGLLRTRRSSRLRCSVTNEFLARDYSHRVRHRKHRAVRRRPRHLSTALTVHYRPSFPLAFKFLVL